MSDIGRIEAERAGRRGASRKRALAAVAKIIRDYEEGRGASACMADIKAAMAGLSKWGGR
ncbi:hypothetical protein [Devosia sp. 63-57]|uniref:hypothetical protein n=1 Tax=Devosia sp. 63-57 TaxID=1895751 RepID=UPI00086C03AF|nr:hypothetical protein [Devosia sp. 63-57]ODT50279.1 MAG: hypothetical protein ABS74_05010 [Pelagibacterium sp. SCN 63-126]ODU82743.1 MAG: hypothetical protein ABT14_16500 [Pelagibacterium sp. SCN 63-17]OJX45023.1 MAG: hypothetical protein BGO80_04010 [Devosia sp. 63-57]